MICLRWKWNGREGERMEGSASDRNGRGEDMKGSATDRI